MYFCLNKYLSTINYFFFCNKSIVFVFFLIEIHIKVNILIYAIQLFTRKRKSWIICFSLLRFEMLWFLSRLRFSHGWFLEFLSDLWPSPEFTQIFGTQFTNICKRFVWWEIWLFRNYNWILLLFTYLSGFGCWPYYVESML